MVNIESFQAKLVVNIAAYSTYLSNYLYQYLKFYEKLENVNYYYTQSKQDFSFMYRTHTCIEK